jgi:hypothetical protein
MGMGDEIIFRYTIDDAMEDDIFRLVNDVVPVHSPLLYSSAVIAWCEEKDVDKSDLWDALFSHVIFNAHEFMEKRLLRVQLKGECFFIDTDYSEMQKVDVMKVYFCHEY